MAATSNDPPIRSAITLGPLNAFSIGTCWSRSIPTSSAFGSLVSSTSADGSPVSHKGEVDMAAFCSEGGLSRTRGRRAARGLLRAVLGDCLFPPLECLLHAPSRSGREPPRHATHASLAEPLEDRRVRGHAHHLDLHRALG